MKFPAFLLPLLASQALACDFIPRINERELEVSTVSSTGPGCASQCLAGTGVRNVLHYEILLENIGQTDCQLGAFPKCDAPSKAAKKSGPLYEYNECRNSWDVPNFYYATLTTKDRKVIASNKHSLVCLSNTECQNPNNAEVYFTCKNQGLSSNCIDRSEKGSPCQWLDVEDILDQYGDQELMFSLHVNYQKQIKESNHDNNVFSKVVVLNKMKKDYPSGIRRGGVATCPKV